MLRTFYLVLRESTFAVSAATVDKSRSDLPGSPREMSGLPDAGEVGFFETLGLNSWGPVAQLVRAHA